MTEVEGENERHKVIVKQKEQEILDSKKVYPLKIIVHVCM